MLWNGTEIRGVENAHLNELSAMISSQIGIKV
jgi:hypothetical protein